MIHSSTLYQRISDTIIKPHHVFQRSCNQKVYSILFLESSEKFLFKYCEKLHFSFMKIRSSSRKIPRKKKQMERYVKWEYLKLKMAFIYLTRYDASMAFMKTNDKSLFLRKHEAELMCLFWLFHFSVSFCIQLKSINKNCL